MSVWQYINTFIFPFPNISSRSPSHQLQAPSVKGFDFAKLHLGQQSKDDVMVIQEAVQPGPGPGPLPLCFKDGFSPSENGEIPTPLSKASTKASRSSRRRDRSVLQSDSKTVKTSPNKCLEIRTLNDFSLCLRRLCCHGLHAKQKGKTNGL